MYCISERPNSSLGNTMKQMLTWLTAGCLAAVSIQAADTNIFSLNDGDRVAFLGDGLLGREQARFVPLLEPLATRNYFPVPPPLADVAGRFGDYGCRRLAEAVAMGFTWEPHIWQIGLLPGGAVREGYFGALFSDVVWETNRVRVTVLEEQLPRAPWAPGEPAKFLKTPPLVFQFAGLAPGNYLLKMDEKVVDRISQVQCERGLRYWRGPQFDQAEQVRQAIRHKNELVFHQTHPNDSCPFPDHAASPAPQSSEELDRLIQAEEAKIARLRQPVKHVLELVPAPISVAPPGASPLSLPRPSQP